MRNPATNIDPAVEAAIEETRALLEPRVNTRSWKRDHDWHAIQLCNAFLEIEKSSLSKGAKLRVRGPLLEAMKKRRRGKPTLHFRDSSISAVAIPLLEQGYDPTRNDETRYKESASSIIREALRRLGVTMEEKTINAIVLKYATLFVLK
jgi:nicotinamidase-related amidase